MLSRITNKHVKILGGVCAGIAYKFELPVLLVRLICALSAFFPVINILMLITYISFWIFSPTLSISEADFKDRTRIYKTKKKDINYENLFSEVKSEAELTKSKEENINERKY